MANSYWTEELRHGVLLYLSPSFPHVMKKHIFFSIITINIKEGSSILRNVDVQKQLSGMTARKEV